MIAMTLIAVLDQNMIYFNGSRVARVQPPPEAPFDAPLMQLATTHMDSDAELEQVVTVLRRALGMKK